MSDHPDRDERHLARMLRKKAVIDERIANSPNECGLLLVLRTHAPAWRSRPGRWLAAATVAVAVLALALPYLAPVAGLLGFVPLPLPVLATLLGVVAAYVAATEAAKRWFWRSRRKGLRQ